MANASLRQTGSYLPALAEDVDLLERREKVLRLRHQGGSYRDIAKACGVSLDTVYSDFRAMRQEWLRKIARARSVWMSELVGRVESLRELALQKFAESSDSTLEKSVESSEKGTKRRRARKWHKNDPRYLSIALECDKQCAAILGLGEKAAVDRVDEMLGKRRPKLLVVRDRAQASQLVDVSKLLELEFAKPEAPQDDTIDGEILPDGGQPVPGAAGDDKPQDAI